MDSKKCKCGAGNKIFCKKCSKIQMCILLKNGNDHLKLENLRGHKANPVWYSHLKYNFKPEKDIIEGMLRRFYNTPLVPSTNIVKFYYNGTNTELFTYKL
ncbi:hypothetical protein FK178_09755 [Antarcticibacterium arcticum]|uniref:Uncharacterized protein n=1 Tax=Antarcticibacterium arcticum TaxID=2585771 RepID=A0A5B8YMZ3_9FLAO|nr:hypothetical protein [Antarcticibacterium arcticum]QED37993.1 hypothetical protein FK178_09755 [Antarcticibacterium arcticum]